jgi:hypothetical protein
LGCTKDDDDDDEKEKEEKKKKYWNRSNCLLLAFSPKQKITPLNGRRVINAVCGRMQK